MGEPDYPADLQVSAVHWPVNSRIIACLQLNPLQPDCVSQLPMWALGGVDDYGPRATISCGLCVVGLLQHQTDRRSPNMMIRAPFVRIYTQQSSATTIRTSYQDSDIILDAGLLTVSSLYLTNLSSWHEN